MAAFRCNIFVHCKPSNTSQMTKPSKKMRIDEMRRKLIKDLYSTTEYVNIFRGVHRTLNRDKLFATSDQRIVLKWPLDLSFTAYYKVRTFRNVFLCAYFNLIWVKVHGLKFMSDPQLQSLPRRVKYLHFFTDFVKLSRRS